MDQCSKLACAPMFKDGRKICPDTLPQDTNAPMINYNVICKCDKNPNGCINNISVFTDAIEAVRDSFIGRDCFNNVTSLEIKVYKV